MIAPGGQRFAVDEERQYVSWMDYTFYYTFRRDSGLRLFDIKYKNETIIYELGLNEALAHYAGNDPVQSGTAYLDTYYGFGPYAFELVPDYDCPTYAKFVNSTFHANEVSTTHRRSICFFEETASFPMQRHANGNYIAATKNVVFKMKSASTVGSRLIAGPRFLRARTLRRTEFSSRVQTTTTHLCTASCSTEVSASK